MGDSSADLDLLDFYEITDLRDALLAGSALTVDDFALDRRIGASPFAKLDRNELTIAEQLLHEAHDLWRSGLPEQAAHRLNLLLHPKWSSEGACRNAYRKHMSARRTGPLP